MYFPTLRQRVKNKPRRLPNKPVRAARRELTQPFLGNALAIRGSKRKLFWASRADDEALTPVTVDLPLGSDPVLRAKQVLNSLLAGPVDTELRTLPPDAALLEFYLLPNGTGVADFSEALATSTPSGIASEQLAVESIARTLEANVPQVKRLKILIHGQEVDTLAGHLDLTGTFTLFPAPALPAATTKKAVTARPPFLIFANVRF